MEDSAFNPPQTEFYWSIALKYALESVEGTPLCRYIDGMSTPYIDGMSTPPATTIGP